VRTAADWVAERVGRCDVLVNNAAILSTTPGHAPAPPTSRRSAAGLRSERILVNAICPGWTATDMGGHGGRPVTDGAASVIWAATLPDNGPTGGCFRDGLPLPW
jgi:NAD(P)-dependent dehydrogenase (short-subunit alcohol dehydrogenase family)